MEFDLKSFRRISIPSQDEIMANWGEASSLPLVSIICTTYNQKSYIEDAIRGFLIQKTVFPFEVVIHDDSSTDGTAEIVRLFANKYPAIITPIIQTNNQYSQGVDIWELVASQAVGKYLAICEGDDFWVDQYKIASQVKFIERKNCGLVYTSAFVFRQKERSSEVIGKAYVNNDLLLTNPIPTLTTFFRRDMYLSYISEIMPGKRGWKMSDYPLWLWFHSSSSVVFLPRITSVYRVLNGTASRPGSIFRRLEFHESSFRIADFFARRLCSNDEYQKFSETRLFFLYLFCLANGLVESTGFLARLQSLNTLTRRKRIVLFILDVLQIGSLLPLLRDIRRYLNPVVISIGAYIKGRDR